MFYNTDYNENKKGNKESIKKKKSYSLHYAVYTKGIMFRQQRKQLCNCYKILQYDWFIHLDS